MILMLDDVQLADENVFFPYVSNAFGMETDGITTLDKLYDVVSEYDDELDVMIHDLNDVSEEGKKFARAAANIFMDARMTNKKLKVTFMSAGKETV